AVPEVQQSEAGPVARRSVIEPGQDEVAPRIGLENKVARADRVEKLALRKGQVLFAARLHFVLDDFSQGQRIRVAIAPFRIGRDLQRLSDGVCEYAEA